MSCTHSEVGADSLLSEIITDGRLTTEFSYDSEGKLVLVRQHEPEYVEELSYEYNSEGLLVMLSVTYSFDPAYNGTVYYDYNEQGMLVSLSYHYESDIIKQEYVYDLNGIITEGYTFYNGEKIGYITYKYDEAGNTIERTDYDNDGSQLSVLRLEYGDYGNPYPPGFFKSYISSADISQKNNVIYFYHWYNIPSATPIEYSSTFEYNDAGLPVKETRHYLRYDLPSESEAALLGMTPQDIEDLQKPRVIEYIY